MRGEDEGQRGVWSSGRGGMVSATVSHRTVRYGSRVLKQRNLRHENARHEMALGIKHQNIQSVLSMHGDKCIAPAAAWAPSSLVSDARFVNFLATPALSSRNFLGADKTQQHQSVSFVFDWRLAQSHLLVFGHHLLIRTH